jgi:hypothetical protein
MPMMNSRIERWIQTCRRELLDRILDAEIQDWQRVISSLSASGWTFSFFTTLRGERVLEDAGQLF